MPRKNSPAARHALLAKILWMVRHIGLKAYKDHAEAREELWLRVEAAGDPVITNAFFGAMAALKSLQALCSMGERDLLNFRPIRIRKSHVVAAPEGRPRSGKGAR